MPPSFATLPLPLIHPAQGEPATAGVWSSHEEIVSAARGLARGRAALDGPMTDAPVRLRIEKIEAPARRSRETGR